MRIDSLSYFKHSKDFDPVVSSVMILTDSPDVYIHSVTLKLRLELRFFDWFSPSIYSVGLYLGMHIYACSSQSNTSSTVNLKIPTCFCCFDEKQQAARWLVMLVGLGWLARCLCFPFAISISQRLSLLFLRIQSFHLDQTIRFNYWEQSPQQHKTHSIEQQIEINHMILFKKKREFEDSGMGCWGIFIKKYQLIVFNAIRFMCDLQQSKAWKNEHRLLPTLLEPNIIFASMNFWNRAHSSSNQGNYKLGLKIMWKSCCRWLFLLW